MKRLIILALLFSPFLAAREEIAKQKFPIPIASYTTEYLEQMAQLRENPLTATAYKIIPKVDVISGNYLEEETDLIVAGNETLSIRRFYQHLAPFEPRYGNWRYNPECFAVANFEFGKSSQFAAVGEANGSVHCFEKLQNNSISNNRIQGQYYADPSRQTQIMATHGQEHPLNFKISYQRPNQSTFFYEGEIINGNGGKRLF